MPTHTIDAGIGTFTANCTDNLKLKLFLDTLKDRIELDGKLDDIIQFLDGDMNSIKELEDRNKELENDLAESINKIEELKYEILELEDKDEVEDEIDGGLGSIGYKADNLLTQQVMEELEVAINKTDPLKVLRHLQNI